MRVTQALRQGSVEDAVDGVVPSVVAVPERPEDLTQVLAAATLDKQLTVLRGGASKLGWGRPP
jgi:glycolate oxidase FAD binding subunit